MGNTVAAEGSQTGRIGLWQRYPHWEEYWEAFGVDLRIDQHWLQFSHMWQNSGS